MEKTLKELGRFAEIVQQLRSENGCPWDRAQTHQTLRRCLVEETGEFLDAVEDNDFDEMKEELGDLLLQVVLHSQIATEEGKFTLEEVVREEAEKLLRRHPHVFGDVTVSSPEEALKSWEKSKTGEAGNQQKRKSAMDGVPRSVPGLARAQKALVKAAKTGFEWEQLSQAIAKIEEELAEVKAAIQEENQEHLQEELGDLLFATVGLCHWKKIEAEEVMHQATVKFMNRFRRLEELAQGGNLSLQACTVSQLVELWKQCKIPK